MNWLKDAWLRLQRWRRASPTDTEGRMRQLISEEVAVAVSALDCLLGMSLSPKLVSSPDLRRAWRGTSDATPSGASDLEADRADESHGRPAPSGRLHICPKCGSQFVQPVRWRQTATRRRWRISRRCPECEWRSDDIREENEIVAFVEALEAGTETLTRELRERELTRMRELVELFSSAFAADLISAEDFRTRPHPLTRG